MAIQRINVSFFHEIVTANDCRNLFTDKPDLYQQIQGLPYKSPKLTLTLN